MLNEYYQSVDSSVGLLTQTPFLNISFDIMCLFAYKNSLYFEWTFS